MNLEQQLIGLLQGLIIGLLNIGVGYLIYYVRQLAESAKIKNTANKNVEQKKLFDNSINRLEDLIVKSVTSTNETIGKYIKQGVEDGKVDEKELLALKDNVLNDVKSQLTQDVNDALSTEINDLDKYIGNSIELVLKDLKDKNMPNLEKKEG